MDRSLLDYKPEIEAFEGSDFALKQYAVRSASDEMQRAAELLEHVEEGKLEAHLVELIDRAAYAPTRSVTRALVGLLKPAALRLLQRDGSPPVALAARTFGLELEGLSGEDQAFEVARRFVRFASEASRRAHSINATASPQVAALRGATSAARTLAPGLLSAPRFSGANPKGFWFRRGRQLIVLNP